MVAGALTLAEDLTSIVEKATNPRVGSDVAQQILARLGQGKFRADVLKDWNGACAVTGCTVLEVLRASHIKPWRDCDGLTKVNPRNGLPLVASLDALFDRGLITFSVNGYMLVSSGLDITQRNLLRVPTKLRRRPDAEQAKFLKYHRQKVFVKGARKTEVPGAPTGSA